MPHATKAALKSIWRIPTKQFLIQGKIFKFRKGT
jgi:hypothetical protein